MSGYLQQPVNGYILAGGKSSRMGQDKGLMLFNQKPLVQYVLQSLQTVVNKVIIVANNPAYQQFGCEVIEDNRKGIGPAGGIFTAFNHSATEWNFIVGCDMPFISAPAIEYILHYPSKAQIVIPIYQGKPQPLFGKYATSCKEQWGLLLEQNILKLQLLVAHFQTDTINVNPHPLFQDPFFTNINSGNDVENALKLINNGN